MTVAEKEVVAVCLHVNEVHTLLYGKVIDVIRGLSNCSVPDFVMLFDFLWQQVKAKALDTDTHK